MDDDNCRRNAFTLSLLCMKGLTKPFSRICSLVPSVLSWLLCFYQVVTAQMTLPRKLSLLNQKHKNVLNEPLKNIFFGRGGGFLYVFISRHTLAMIIYFVSACKLKLKMTSPPILMHFILLFLHPPPWCHYPNIVSSFTATWMTSNCTSHTHEHRKCTCPPTSKVASHHQDGKPFSSPLAPPSSTVNIRSTNAH